ncbi:probable endochitinase [Daphnia carinata]|uniref:probable endochitinase n=1 Tax=Daphnia carinata TaxID=120202 RepID=UPI002579A819|nr:probable endochitinase [Daphnia carinata]
MKAIKTVAFVFFIVFQVLPRPSATFRVLTHGKNLRFDSRGEGDIEIGPDPTFQCPPNTPIAPHPERCEQYYTCYPGAPATLWQCYSDYLFDLRYSGCNFPYDTDCGDRLRPGETTVATTRSPPFSCPDNGYYPVSACSDQYYLCVEGDVYPQVCPDGSVFDPNLLYCVMPDQVPTCGATTSSSPTTTGSSITTTVQSHTTPTPIVCEADGFYAFEPCQTVYYACVNGVAYFQECPNGWIFVEAESKCRRPEETDCFDSTTTMATPTTTVNNCDVTTVAPSDFVCPNNETDFLPIYPGACSAKYYTCYVGVAYPQECQQGYIFDAPTRTCVPLETAGCTPCPNFT